MRRRHLLAAGAGAAATGAALPHVAAAQGPAFHRFLVGSLTVTVVTDGSVVREDATRGLIANASPEEVAAAMRAAGLSGQSLDNPYNVSFVETRRGLVAFDTGNSRGANTRVGRLLDNMRAAGLDPARVTLVVFTHFHPDHIGGLATDDGALAFPNAEAFLVPEREWAFWTDASQESRVAENRRPNFALVRRRFAPVQAKVSQFAPGAEVTPGVTAVASPGHSPGHTSFLIADGNAQALLIGDAVNTPAFFMPNPEWRPVFDMDQTMAVETRKRLLDRAATERMPVVGYHFPMPATGRVERAGSGYRLVPANA
jgi:glyoxylase-like metal-dependent hydrolase (beta-lactamase superfamily II)